jgi:hypothetical protein
MIKVSHYDKIFGIIKNGKNKFHGQANNVNGVCSFIKLQNKH